MVIKRVIDKLNGMDYIEGGAGGRSLNLKIFDIKGICMLIHRCMDALACSHICRYTHKFMSTYAHSHIYIHIYKYIQIHTYIHTYICTCIYVLIYTLIHAYDRPHYSCFRCAIASGEINTTGQ